MRSHLAARWEATELLRDLATAVEWLLDTLPTASTFDFEQRRVKQHLEDVHEFIRAQDAQEAAADRAAELRLSLE
jgi:hypothetical protein